MSILSAHGVRIEDISDLVGHSGTAVTESVYRHEIRPALTTGATAMNKILSKKRTRIRLALHGTAPRSINGVATEVAPEDRKEAPDRSPEPL